MTAVETKIETPHLTFSTGLPGFPEAHTFMLIQTDLAREPFSIMKCVEDEELEFVVARPDVFFPDYSPQVDETTAQRIGLDDVDDALLLVILTMGETVHDITANLLGPIVVNRKNYLATQAILINQDFDIKTPLFPKAD